MNKQFKSSLFMRGLLVTGFIFSSLSLAQAQPNIVESDSHRFNEIADGVWFASASGSVYTMSNSMVLIGDKDVLVVDSHVTPTAARALLDSLTVLTDLPVRFLVNSHYHFDHAHGNQAFPDDVDIIGHSFTRAKLSGELGSVLEESTYTFFTEGVPATVENLERLAAEESDPLRKAELEAAHQVQHDYMEALTEIVPTPPNITLEDEMTLFQSTADGSREIQLHHFGRAHTGGDVVVFLPEEKVVFTADMMMGGLAYMGDGFVNEWPQALEGLKSLDFNLLLPGHGQPFADKDRITHFQSYLRDLWQKTEALHNQSISAEQASEQIDLTSHSNNFPQINGPGADVKAIRRIYQLLEE